MSHQPANPTIEQACTITLAGDESVPALPAVALGDPQPTAQKNLARYFSGEPSSLGSVQALPQRTFEELVEQILLKPIPLPLSKQELLDLPPAEANDRKRVGYLVPAVFAQSPSKRQTTKATACNLVFIDIDDSSDASRLLGSAPGALLGDLGAVIYHTARSKLNAPRLRVVVHADAIPAARYPEAVEELGNKLGINPSPESLSSVQPMYLPCSFRDSTDSPIVYVNATGLPFRINPVSGENGPAEPVAAHDPVVGGLEHLRWPVDGITPDRAKADLSTLDPDESYPNWVTTGMALKHQFQEEGWPIWNEWSAKGGKYDGETATRKRWDSFVAQPLDRPPVTYRTIQNRLPYSWETPIPLDLPAPPSLDLSKAIPPHLGQFRSFIQQTATAIQVSEDAVAPLCVGIISAAAGRSYEIRITQDWRETAVLWVAALADPGERKSTVIRHLTNPLFSWQSDERVNLSPALTTYRTERKRLQGRLEGLLKKISQPNATNLAQLQQQSDAIAQDLSAMPELHLPEILTADATPEALRALLFQNGEKAALIAAETDFQQLTGSRYSKDGGQNLNLMLAGKTGDSIAIHRVTKSEPLLRPAIALVMFVQPTAIRDVLRDSNTNGRGFVQRFQIVQAKSLMGYRAMTPPCVSPKLVSWWDSTVRSILSIPWPGRVILAQGKLTRNLAPACELTLDSGASSRFEKFRQNIEFRLRKNEDLYPISGFASKLAGDIARIALALELMVSPKASQIAHATMEAACHWGEFLIAHHKHALGSASETPTRRQARRLIASLEQKPVQSISARDCLRRIQNTTDMTCMSELAPVLNELVEHKYLRLMPPTEPRGRGHPPSRLYEVNPAVSVI